MINNRNYALDVLKMIGLFAIVIAHCHNTPAIVDYLRNFEVVLMVLVSGELMCSRGGIYQPTKTYLWKRIKRIVVPTWTFLTLLFMGIYFLSKMTGGSFPYSVRKIVESYTMINGIGYVWIMLVYCFVALGTPILISIYDKTCKSWLMKTVFCGVYIVVYEAIVYLIAVLLDQNNIFVYILKNTLPYFLAYSYIAAIPFFLKSLNITKKIISGIGMLGLHYILYFVFYGGININEVMSTNKFPPRIVYSLYAIGVSLILIEWVKKCYKGNKIIDKSFAFISKNSQWFYFNHIIMIYVWNMLFMNRFPQWWIMFIFVTAGATILTLCMRISVDFICKKSGSSISKTAKLIFG